MTDHPQPAHSKLPDLETLRCVISETGFVTATLNRPKQHNALSPQMIADLQQLAGHVTKESEANGRLRALIITANGSSFCAGGDLNWMRSQQQVSKAEKCQEARKLAMMLHSLNAVPIPVVAKVQGNVFGGGLGILSICDTVIAADHCRFGLTEARLGLIPATISPYVHARLGTSLCRHLFTTASLFSADNALSWGLVHKITSVDSLDDALSAYIEDILKTSPQASRAAKALAKSFGPHISKEEIERTINILSQTWETEDAKSGLAAFFAKSSPPWAMRSEDV